MADFYKAEKKFGHHRPFYLGVSKYITVVSRLLCNRGVDESAEHTTHMFVCVGSKCMVL
jgi:hypothetical protein